MYEYSKKKRKVIRGKKPKPINQSRIQQRFIFPVRTKEGMAIEEWLVDSI